MSEEAAAAIDARLAKLGAGESMKGESGDRRFKAHGRWWRVRVRVKDEIAPDAPVTGSPELAPARLSVSVSVAPLLRGNVAKDDGGRTMVFPASVMTLQEEAFGRSGFDPGREILIAVADQIDAAAAQLDGRRKLPGALAAWSETGKSA